MKTILITGGSGFIGHHLCRDLVFRRWRVQVLTRDARRARQRLPPEVTLIESLDEAEESDAVVNLAGEDIAGRRWTREQKQVLIDSRLRVTHALIDALSCWRHKPQVLLSGSAVGYYGAAGAAPLDEKTPAGDEFQATLCAEWERAALPAAELGIRVCFTRTALVLDDKEGALSYMIKPFKWGLGGPLGSGRQYLSWIHIRDQVRAMRFLIESTDCSGAFNLSAPGPVTNHKFTATLARLLDRPRLGWVPGPVLRFVVGQRARLMLTGQRVLPTALTRAGFTFEFPSLECTLRDLLAIHA